MKGTTLFSQVVHRCAGISDHAQGLPPQSNVSLRSAMNDVSHDTSAYRSNERRVMVGTLMV